MKINDNPNYVKVIGFVSNKGSGFVRCESEPFVKPDGEMTQEEMQQKIKLVNVSFGKLQLTDQFIVE